MVIDETHLQEIMKAFGFKTAAQVIAALYRALVEIGEIPEQLGCVAVVRLRRRRRSGSVIVVPLSFRRIWWTVLGLVLIKNLRCEGRRLGLR